MDSKKFLSTSHKVLVPTEGWARNGYCRGLELAKIKELVSGPVAFQRLHSTAVLNSQSASADTASFREFPSPTLPGMVVHVCDPNI